MTTCADDMCSLALSDNEQRKGERWSDGKTNNGWRNQVVVGVDTG